MHSFNFTFYNLVKEDFLRRCFLVDSEDRVIKDPEFIRKALKETLDFIKKGIITSEDFREEGPFFVITSMGYDLYIPKKAIKTFGKLTHL